MVLSFWYCAYKVFLGDTPHPGHLLFRNWEVLGVMERGGTHSSQAKGSLKRQHFLELSEMSRVCFWLKLGTRGCLLNSNCHLTCLHAPCDLIPLDPCPSFCSLRIILDITSPTCHYTGTFWGHLSSSSQLLSTSFQGTQSSPVTWSSLSPLQTEDHVDGVPRHFPVQKSSCSKSHPPPLFSSSCSFYYL